MKTFNCELTLALECPSHEPAPGSSTSAFPSSAAANTTLLVLASRTLDAYAGVFFFWFCFVDEAGYMHAHAYARCLLLASVWPIAYAAAAYQGACCWRLCGLLLMPLRPVKVLVVGICVAYCICSTKLNCCTALPD